MPPVLIADRYHVLRELGRGGMGVVYQVLHTQTGEQHALKVLLGHKAAKGDSVERFKRELKLPARIQSEHVVQVFDSGEVEEEDGAPFYVMELLRGCDLRKLLDTKHVFTPREIIWLLHQLAQGLSKAHEIGIVHRDLKPDNIFLHSRDGGRLVVKILDFGIARYAQDLLETGDQEKLTATQAMLGTPLYMAPEQAKAGEGRAEIGPCTDVWAVGMIAFELLTGRTYWNAISLVQHLGQLLFATMVPASQRAPEVPSGFDAWFARSCNRDSGSRFPSVVEQVDQLARILATTAPEREPPSALLAAVNKRMPPLVDHRSPTMMVSGVSQGSGAARFSSRGLDEETRQLGSQKRLAGSAEQNVRAELVPGRSSGALPGSSIKLKARTALGGVLLMSLGAFALAISLRKPMTRSGSLAGPTDGGTKVVASTPRMDLSAPADLAESPPPVRPLPGRKPAKTKPKTPATPKADKPAAPREEAPKGRRTYVPPSL